MVLLVHYLFGYDSLEFLKKIEIMDIWYSKSHLISFVLKHFEMKIIQF